MKARALSRVLCVVVLCGIVTGSLLSQGKKGSPPGKVDAYSIAATALKGPSTTEVTVTLQTNDPAQFPIPGILKKVQIKGLNNDGDVVYIKNFKDVNVVNDGFAVDIDDL